MTFELPECDTLSESVAAMHELFITMQAQGFTRHEAIHMLTGTCCPRLDGDE